MRIWIVLIASPALFLASCSKAPSDGKNATESETPDINPDAAPGIAFRYDYVFALGPTSIAALQEKHAAACEALGPARCRITGVSFQRLGADDVTASLQLALARDLARKFGRDAASAVETAQGQVRAIEIATDDLNQTIATADASAQAAHDDTRRLQNTQPDKASNSTIAQQITNARDTAREAEERGAAARQAVAWTPVRFSYGTDGFMPGFSIGDTVREALVFAGRVLALVLSVLIVLITLALPAGIILLAGSHARAAAGRIWSRFAAKRAPLED